MKIALLSDLHLNVNPPLLLPILAEYINHLGVDYFISAGDLAGNYRQFIDYRRRLQDKLAMPLLTVAGNHDLWRPPAMDEGDINSDDIYREIAKQPGSLSGASVKLSDSWAVIGESGWYDYSFAAPSFSRQQLAAMQYQGKKWQDAYYSDWCRDPQKISNEFIRRLRQKLADRAECNIILVTHFVFHKKFTVPLDYPDAADSHWPYFNGFLGSKELAQFVVDNNRRIKIAVCGHVHFRQHFYENGINYICHCLGYRRQWRQNDIAAEIEQATLTLDLD